jgi:hypothetical protein
VARLVTRIITADEQIARRSLAQVLRADQPAGERRVPVA